MKRQYKILLIIFLVILLAVGAYFGIRALVTPSPVEEPDTDISTTTDPDGGDISVDPDESEEDDTSTTTVEEPEERVPVLISDEDKQVFDFWINQSTNTINYITISGNVYSVQQEQEDSEVSSQSIRALNFLKQSPSGEYMLAAFGDPKNPNWGIFDITDGVWRPLPSSVDKATWLNEDDDLVLIVQAGSERRLERISVQNGSVLESDIGTNVIVSDFRLRDINMDATSENQIIITEKPNTSYSSRMWEITIDGNSSIINLIEGEIGLYTKWSDDFVFKYNTPDNFFILDHNLNNAVPVFFTTLPDKCGQGDEFIFCGVPQSGISGSSNDMPNAYLQKEMFTIDNLYQINIDSLETQRMFDSDTGDIAAMNIKNLRVINGDVYFINRYDEGLYRVSL